MAWLKNLNWIDVLIIILLLRGVILGFIHGFLYEFVKFFRVILALIISFFSYPFLAKVINSRLTLSLSISNILSFILIYILFYFLSNLLGIRTKEVKRNISSPERIFGVCIGLLKGAVIAFFILLFLNLLPLSSLKTAVKEKSLLAPYLLDSGTKIWELIKKK
ncbi:MAG: CvpA family protein [Candidatus Omnitrophica bacterium]|nr:CvpA family protein [Candidatus Omnitrophota bacterium]